MNGSMLLRERKLTLLVITNAATDLVASVSVCMLSMYIYMGATAQPAHRCSSQAG